MGILSCCVGGFSSSCRLCGAGLHGRNHNYSRAACTFKLILALSLCKVSI